MTRFTLCYKTYINDEYFESLYTESNCVLFDILTPQNINLPTFNISISITFDKFNQLDPKKGARPDSVTPCILKYCNFHHSHHIYFIFNKCFATCAFPNYWRVSFITPIQIWKSIQYKKLQTYIYIERHTKSFRR